MSPTPPPLDPTSPPVSSRQRLLAKLQKGWGEAAPDQGEGEHLRMVPRCFPLPSSSAKRTSPLQPVCQVELKKLKLFSSMDINSNRVLGQGIFSLYKDAGGGEGSSQCREDMSSSRSLVVTSSPTTTQEAVSQVLVSTKQQTVLASLNVTRSGGGGHVLDKIALSPVDVEQALVSSGHCDMINRLEVEDLVKKSENNVDRLMKNLEYKMSKVKESSKHGLVHWGGANQLEWTCLGEVEDQQVQESTDWRNWVVEGVRSGTKGVRRRFGFGEKKEDKTSDRDELGSVWTQEDDIYDFDIGDEVVLGQTKNILNKVSKYIDDSDDNFIDDDEDWSQKPKKKGKGRGKGNRSGKGVMIPVVKTPSVDEYFEKVPSIKDLHISQQGPSSLDVDNVDGLQTPSASSTHRVVGTIDYSRTKVEMRGTCPMCSKEMGMAVLPKHASACQG